MNNIKSFFLFAFLLAFLVGCQKDYNDTSFLKTAGAPSNLSALTTVTQDNSGLVTITPYGENVSYYEVYFGDVTTAPAKVFAGTSVQHKYAEGVYEITIVGHSIAGTITTSKQKLTVSFRTPEKINISTTVDGVNNFKINLSATALYETYFKVYFGDAANEVPQSFLEGDTLGHVYPKIGSYIIKVVAFSGAKDSLVKLDTISITDPLILPLNFESTTLNYNFLNFDGGNSSVIDNPQKNGINTSNKVCKMVKNAGQVWGGSLLSLSGPINFSTNKIFRMKVFSPRVGAKVLLKVENPSNNNVFYQVETATTIANSWEDLVFDYSAINTSNVYNNIVIIFDNGKMGDGSADYTFLYDDIRLTNTLPATTIALPLDFESTTLKYAFTDFNGGGVTIINNPQVSGINTSSRVAQMVKSGGAVYGGSYITLSSPVDFALGKTITMKVYSPRVGAKVLLKFENLTDGNVFTQQEVATTTSNAWELLTFNFTDVSKTYQKVVLIFDNGTMGDGSANFTYLFDDINQK